MQIKDQLISIIVPVYKVPEAFLRQCIESCINQTYRNVEIILVDDGSPDDCGRICDEYAAKDKRIIVIHKENGGLVSARNAGYEVMSGEWHMYLDGDDWIDTNCLTEVLHKANEYDDPNVVFWNVVQYLDGKHVQGKAKWTSDSNEKLYTEDDCKELARQTMVYSSGLTPAYAKLINTRWAREYNIKHDARLKQGAEGVEFTLRLFYFSKSALFLNKNYNYYRYTPLSISKAINEMNTIYLTDCFKVIEEDIKGFDNANEIKPMFYQRVVYGLIAIAMSTYFHPNNPDRLSTKIRKFKEVINSTLLYVESVKKCPTTCMDTLRVIILYILKMRMYWLLTPIAETKQWLLKKGYFSY